MPIVEVKSTASCQLENSSCEMVAEVCEQDAALQVAGAL